MFQNRILFLVSFIFFSTISHSLIAQTNNRFPEQKYGFQKANTEAVIDVAEEKTNPNSEAWTLEKSIAFALKNNLQLSENELNQRMQDLTLAQSKASRIPALNADVSLGNSYGRSVDPTSNQFINQGFLFNNMSLNSQVLLFGWFQKKNEIEKNKFAVLAANEAYEQLRDNIALNVANGYLRVLLAQEQVKVANELINTDLAQLAQTNQFVKAGKLPQLNLEQMNAQVASDSSALINAETEVQLALLQLRAILNLDYQTPFQIQAPDLKTNELLLNDKMLPADEVVALAMKNQHRIKAQQLNINAAEKEIDQAKGARYPSLFLGGNLSTSYSSQFKQVTNQRIVGQRQVGSVTVAGNEYPITTPEYDFTTSTIPYTSQLDNNTRSNIALTMNIPIFNGHQVKTNVARAQIGLQNQRIALQQEQQNLQQDIRTATLQATAAQQKYKASLSNQQSAKRALDFAIKRYNIGILPTFEYTQTQNNYNQASYNALAAKYEMIFKMKVLDFYIGNPIKF